MDDIRTYSDSVSECVEKADKSREDYDPKYEVFRHHLQTYMAFGDFDRITFNGVDRFSRFFDLDQRSKYWLGKHQNIFLYRIARSSDDPCRVYPYKEEDHQKKPQDNDFGFCVVPRESEGLPYKYSALTGRAAYEDGGDVDSDIIFPFFLLSQLSFSNTVITRIADYSKFILYVKEALEERLDQLIRNKKFHIQYEIYGCLNTSEIAILWLAREYTDVLNLIDCLKDVRFDIEEYTWGDEEDDTMFFSFYTVIGRMLAYMKCAGDLFPEQYLQYKGTAQIDITVNDRYSASDLYKEAIQEQSLCIMENSCRVSAGEHDLTMMVPAKAVYDQFVEDKIGSSGNGFFKREDIRKKILGARITLSAGGEELEKPTEGIERICIPKRIIANGKEVIRQFTSLSRELDPTAGKLELSGASGTVAGWPAIWSKEDEEKIKKATIRELYLTIRERMKERFNSHTGAVDTLDMLYTDYLSNIHESYNALWRSDYHYQFKKSLVYLLFIVCGVGYGPKGVEESRKEYFWNRFTGMIDNIRQQTQHFSQSSRLVIRIPASHLRYTASADAMFHCYYGMAKSILRFAYDAQEPDQRQSELLPIITTNSTPLITSRLYNAGCHCDDLRILQVDIPYSLLFDPIEGFPYLTHELFHYITPRRRQERNAAICSMIVNEALSFLYVYQIEDGINRYLFEMAVAAESSGRPFEEGIKLDESTDSGSSRTFEDQFKEYVQEKSNALWEIQRGLAVVLWEDPVITQIRNQIVEESLEKGKRDEDQATWGAAIQSIFQHLGELSIDRKTVISRRLLENMNESECLWQDRERQASEIGKTYRMAQVYKQPETIRRERISH